MKGWVDLEATQRGFEHGAPGLEIQGILEWARICLEVGRCSHWLIYRFVLWLIAYSLFAKLDKLDFAYDVCIELNWRYVEMLARKRIWRYKKNLQRIYDIKGDLGPK